MAASTRQPNLTYKSIFLFGGALFALASYLAGTWLYAVELYIWGRQTAAGNLWTLLALIPTEHPLTFFPWLVATTGIAILIGYMFDRQVQLRVRLEAMAVTDGLTLVYNHRYVVQQLSLEINRHLRGPQRFGVLLLDIDDFKRYNDTRGHLAGDDALRMVAQTIRATVRDVDVVGRYGGEEFVVLVHGASTDQSAVLAERIRRSIQERSPVTVSIGVAAFPENGGSTEALIREADRAMYEAKGAGKNRIIMASRAPGAELPFGSSDLESVHTDRAAS